VTLPSAASTALLLLTLSYTLVCCTSPFGRCRHAAGIRSARTCRRCHGTGRRARTGVHLYNAARRLTRGR
jgi:hypothetical protein